MSLTKWWKCDLQVATPAWDFTLPSASSYDFKKASDRSAFADLYMAKLKAEGIEVIAIADHNSADWVDDMKEAGARAGIVVFPGCEVTTNSGADGVHILIIGDPSKTKADFDVVLTSNCGYDHDCPRFADGKPLASPKSLVQILDGLPDGYLVIGPHALNENGIASAKTVKGDIRWKALHHARLSAIDVGFWRDDGTDSFNNTFRTRRLTSFPCLRHLAFISTSDAYSIDQLGSNFTWIRMCEPSIEGLRQAFLDYEARIICDWDDRLKGFPGSNPNAIRHAWIEHVDMKGLGNSLSPLSVRFHPCLNVIIGGRGSGKSTIVAAIRQLYGTTTSLPEKVRQEAEGFSLAVLSSATINSKHLLPTSQERQSAAWSAATGQVTGEKNPVPTTFPVRIINQKELYERVSRDTDDPLAASRSFLSFLDEGLGFQRLKSPAPGTWWRNYEAAQQDWINATVQLLTTKSDTLQLPNVIARIRELEQQIAAFDSDAAKERRTRNSSRHDERTALDERVALVKEWLSEVQKLAASEKLAGLKEDERARADQLVGREPSTAEEPQLPPEDPFRQAISQLEAELAKVVSETEQALLSVAAGGDVRLGEWIQLRDRTEWWKAVVAAASDSEVYLSELKAKGIDPSAYQELLVELDQKRSLLQQLRLSEQRAKAASDAVELAWQNIQAQMTLRREKRAGLLSEVVKRSGQLQFELLSHEDHLGWTRAVRELLNLRADGFIEDVEQTATWLWSDGAAAEREARQKLWRDAVATGDFSVLNRQAKLKQGWVRKLQSLDQTLRLRLAVEIADDRVEMLFLKEGGRHDQPADWQRITEGSAGQRTAAMLGFVLHHGNEPLVLDQPEDDLDTELISNLVVRELRSSRCKRQVVVITHNANIPVNGDAEQVVVLENRAGSIQLRAADETGVNPTDFSYGAIERACVRRDIQKIMEGGIRAFIQRENRYSNELRIAAHH